MLNPADARSPFPPLFLGLLTRAVWSSVSICFRKTRTRLKIGDNMGFTYILKGCFKPEKKNYFH